MATITFRMTDQDAELVRKRAKFEGVTVSDFARAATLERAADSYDLEELHAAITSDSGERAATGSMTTESLPATPWIPTRTFHSRLSHQEQ